MFKHSLAIIAALILMSTSAQAVENEADYSLTESIQGLSFLFEKLSDTNDINNSKYQLIKRMTPNGYEYLFTPKDPNGTISSGDNTEYVDLGVGKAFSVDNAMKQCNSLTLKDKKWRLISDLDLDNLIISQDTDIIDIIIPSKTSRLIWVDSNSQDIFSSGNTINTAMIFLKDNKLSYNGFYSEMISELSTICISL
ncbi:TPA: hypothetical protein ACX6S6_002307 [Photobacterium damselae]